MQRIMSQRLFHKLTWIKRNMNRRTGSPNVVLNTSYRYFDISLKEPAVRHMLVILFR